MTFQIQSHAVHGSMLAPALPGQGRQGARQAELQVDAIRAAVVVPFCVRSAFPARRGRGRRPRCRGHRHHPIVRG